MRVIDFIVCDDIRQEVGNKISLMGIFADSIVLQQEVAWPIRMNLGVFVRAALEPEEPGPDAYSLSVTCNDRAIAEAHANAPQGAGARLLTFMVHLRPMPIPEPGVLEFRVQFLRNGEQAGEPAAYSVRVQAYGEAEVGSAQGAA